MVSVCTDLKSAPISIADGQRADWHLGLQQTLPPAPPERADVTYTIDDLTIDAFFLDAGVRVKKIVAVFFVPAACKDFMKDYVMVGKFSGLVQVTAHVSSASGSSDQSIGGVQFN